MANYSLRRREFISVRKQSLQQSEVAMPENRSCPNCDARPMIRKEYLTVSRLKKLKMDIGALCCCRRYCPVGLYKIVFRCPSCGWEGDPDQLH